MKILVAGHSHVNALAKAFAEGGQDTYGAVVEVLNFRDMKYRCEGKPPRSPEEVRIDVLAQDFSELSARHEVVAFCLNGNEHNSLGLFKSKESFDVVEGRIRSAVHAIVSSWMSHLLPLYGGPAVLVLPPPPNESEEFILGTKRVQALERKRGLREASERLALWRAQCEVIAAIGSEFGLSVLVHPPEIYSPSGFLAEDFRGDLTHGNKAYGDRVLRSLIELASANVASTNRGRAMPLERRKHPYRFLPNHCFWKQSVSQVAADAVDPVVSPPFKIQLRDRVATAGSCFAQHISKHLRAGGFELLVTESTGGDRSEHGNSSHDFSARYGNVYTARQLLQLFDRAFGYYRPQERVWKTVDGRFCDPFRPTIHDGGYVTKEEVLEDAKRHLFAVRKMFRQLDVFVFTLGLTECWASRLDGAVYPMAPGVAGGVYDPERHAFVNFSVSDVVSDMQLFIKKLRVVNPKAKIILTVSPVPLAATYENRHVLVSTTYSKSVLRVAAEEVSTSNDGVYYFPAFEIITGSHAAGGYFDPDKRGVTTEGVSHVMRVFMARMTEEGAREKSDHDNEFKEAVEAMGEALCDEEMLAR